MDIRRIAIVLLSIGGLALVGYSAYCFVTVTLPYWLNHPMNVLGILVGMAVAIAAGAALKKLAAWLWPALSAELSPLVSSSQDQAAQP